MEDYDMAYSIQKVAVWTGEIKDRPGALAEKMEALAQAGANLEFVIARRTSRGKGIVFMAPVKGARQIRAAAAADIVKSDKAYALRIEGTDKAGIGATVTKTLADAGINVRGATAFAIGKKCVFYLAFDTPEDSTKARRILNKTL